MAEMPSETRKRLQAAGIWDDYIRFRGGLREVRPKLTVKQQAAVLADLFAPGRPGVPAGQRAVVLAAVAEGKTPEEIRRWCLAGSMDAMLAQRRGDGEADEQAGPVGMDLDLSLIHI